MHIEFLIEDSSGKTLLEFIVPKFIGQLGDPHTWRIHAYRGIGRLPKNGLRNLTDPAKRVLLDQLPRILRGYKRAPGIDAVVVVVDVDTRDCRDFLSELRSLARECAMQDKTIFRLAIEEIEAWYLGDAYALARAYPFAKQKILQAYVQDSVCGTWEVLADAVVAGGSDAVKRGRGPHAGGLKHEWARAMGPLMVPENNLSPSFAKLRDGLRSLTQRSGI